VLRSGGEAVGWSVCLMTAMQENPHFGNLTVGTILDVLAPPEHLGALAGLTEAALGDLGAELIVTNQLHERRRQEFRRLGFLGGPSNYLVALSKPLAASLGAEPGAFGRSHVTRGDGDGRIHL
jgi:hypothetical protein